jgi:hypothetical protein
MPNDQPFIPADLAAAGCFGTTKSGFGSYLAALLLLMVGGNLYGISAYASAIKVQKGFDDNEITMLESVANFGFCICPWYATRE